MTGGAEGRGADGEPRPVAEVDEDLLRALAPLHKVRWVFLTGAGLLMAAGLIFLAVAAGGFRAQLHAAQAEIRASCRFYRTAAGLPLRPTPPLTRPSPVVVTLIASSRDAYHGQGCRPALGPPPRELARWAAQYGVPLGN